MLVRAPGACRAVTHMRVCWGPLLARCQRLPAAAYMARAVCWSWPSGEAIPFDDAHKHFGKGQTGVDLELAPGKHTLTLQFANALVRCCVGDGAVGWQTSGFQGPGQVSGVLIAACSRYTHGDARRQRGGAASSMQVKCCEPTLPALSMTRDRSAAPATLHRSTSRTALPMPRPSP